MPTANYREETTTRDNNNSPSRKRVAIDPNHINTGTYMPDATQRNETQSPLKAALNFLHGTIVTLHTGYQHTVQRVGEAFSKAFDAHHRQSRTLAGMIESTTDAGQPVPARIPRSVRLNFELKTSIKPIQESPEFQQLQQESTAATEAYQNAQAVILIKYKHMEVAHSKNQLLTNLASGLHTLAQGHLLVKDQQDANPHQLVNTTLERDHNTLLEHLDVTLDQFRATYQTTHNLQALPAPIVAAIAAPGPPAAPTPPVAPQPPIPLGPYTLQQLEAINLADIDLGTNILDQHIDPAIVNGGNFQALIDAREAQKQHLMGLIQQDYAALATYQNATQQYTTTLLPMHQQQVAQHQQQLQQYQQQQQQLAQPQLNIKGLNDFRNLAVKVFATTIQQYVNQLASNDRSLALKKFHKETFTAAATEATDMELETETPATQQHIKDLVQKMVQDQMKLQNKKIAKAAATKVNQSLTRQLNQPHSNSKNNQRGPTKGGASNKKKSPSTNNSRTPAGRRGRSRSKPRSKSISRRQPSRSRGRSPSPGPPSRGGRGRGNNQGGRGGRGRSSARGRGNASTGSNSGNNRGRSRSSSKDRRKNSNAGRHRPSRR
jgi:hypothetical protein